MSKNIGYMISPLGLTERQLLIYQKLYEKCNFKDMTVKYTAEQLSCDIRIVSIDNQAIGRELKKIQKLGIVSVIEQGRSGHPTTYKIQKLNENYVKAEQKLKLSNINGLDSGNENCLKTNQKLSENPIKEKENNKKEKDTGLDKIIDSYSDDTELICTIRDFLKMRKAIKKPMTDRALKIMLNKLDKYADTPQKKIKILENSIENSWQGVFPLKDNCTLQHEQKKITDMF